MTTVQQYDDPAAFQRKVLPYLLVNEAYHSLIVGLCATLVNEPWRYPTGNYQAVAENAGEVVGVAICTPPHRVALSLVTDPSVVPAMVADVHRWSPTITGVVGPSDVARVFASHWFELAGVPLRHHESLRVFALDRVTPVRGVPGEMRRATEQDRALLTGWVAAFIEEAFGRPDPAEAMELVEARLASPTGGYHYWWDGEPVSLAGYGGPTPNGIRIGPVYTPPDRRGQGYASALVAGLSQRMLDGGRRQCYLFTDQANPTSNRIYQAIGYRVVGDMDTYRHDER